MLGAAISGCGQVALEVEVRAILHAVCNQSLDVRLGGLKKIDWEAHTAIVACSTYVGGFASVTAIISKRVVQ